MSKNHHPTSKGAYEDDVEMSPLPSDSSSSPLLPTSRKEGAHTPSPHDRVIAARRSRLYGIACCLWAAFVPFFLSMALVVCYFGRTTLDSVREWDAWDTVPPQVKDWLDKVAPYEGIKDHGAFPTNIGYAGPTPTGSEPALLATAPSLPLYSAVAPLVPPSPSSKSSDSNFNIMQSWGNLSPYYSVRSHGLPETSALFPEHCTLDELHWLQRHGARYPTLDPKSGPAGVAARLKAAKGWTASAEMSFLNAWEYKLGAEVLTPFGREQLFNLGVSARLKYGFLLDKMKDRAPVFRTESQDRMLKSAQNFAAGFFGIPAEPQYNLEVQIEWPGFNCTLAPYHSCPRAGENDPEIFRKLHEWDAIFLAKAQKRLQGMMKGYELTTADVLGMMDMCPYETVAIGYSQFCNLFTQKEWKGYDYRNDLYWWYAASFGYPQARAMGMGWVQEMVSRLTHTRLTEFNSSTNSSYHDDKHFPLHDPLYVDFTHDTVFALLLPTMNLTSFAESGEPPLDRIPKHHSFVASKFCPFATNMQIQVLTCGSEKQVRLILNDAVVPLTGIRGCPEDDDGLCPLNTFVSAMQTLIGETDFVGVCGVRNHGSADLPMEQSSPEVKHIEETGSGLTGTDNKINGTAAKASSEIDDVWPA